MWVRLQLCIVQFATSLRARQTKQDCFLKGTSSYNKETTLYNKKIQPWQLPFIPHTKQFVLGQVKIDLGLADF